MAERVIHYDGDQATVYCGRHMREHAPKTRLHAADWLSHTYQYAGPKPCVDCEKQRRAQVEGADS